MKDIIVKGQTENLTSNKTEVQKGWQKMLTSIISFEKHKKLKSLHPFYNI